MGPKGNAERPKTTEIVMHFPPKPHQPNRNYQSHEKILQLAKNEKIKHKKL